MIIALKIYEFIQILFLNIIQVSTFFSGNKKWNKFVFLRNPKYFLEDVSRAKANFSEILLKHPEARLFWFHVSSAGELEQAVPIAQALHTHLNVYFFVTYYSPSAEPFLKNFPACVGTAGLPIDVLNIYQKSYKKLPFEKIFFVRYDIWPALVFFAHNNCIELNLLCATKQKTTSGFRATMSQKWNLYLYKHFKHIFVTIQEDTVFFQKHLKECKVIFAGDSKWYRAKQRAEIFQNSLDPAVKPRDDMDALSSRDLTAGSSFVQFFNSLQTYISQNNLKCIVFGSPHAEEHEIALKCIEFQKSLCIIYVPHDVSEKTCLALKNQIQERGGNPYLYSEIKGLITGPSQGVTIIFDAVGHLAEIYALGYVAVVGGGFDGQIHNVLEPAAHGVPVFIGAKFSRAPEAQTLVSAQAALAFPTPNLLFQFIAQWVTLEGEMKQLQKAKEQSLKLFQNIPNTNEIILKTFLQEIPHDNKTTHH